MKILPHGENCTLQLNPFRSWKIFTNGPTQLRINKLAAVVADVFTAYQRNMLKYYKTLDSDDSRAFMVLQNSSVASSIFSCVSVDAFIQDINKLLIYQANTSRISKSASIRDI